MDAIIYTSNTGYTEKYAKLLGEKTGLAVFSSDKAKDTVKPGSEVIYLGWLMAGKIEGYSKAAASYKICAVCGVGMAKGGLQDDSARKANHIAQNLPLFTLQGGFDMTRLHGIYKFMMKTMIGTVGKKLSKKTDRTPDEDETLNAMQNGGDFVSVDKLKPVLDWYAALS